MDDLAFGVEGVEQAEVEAAVAEDVQAVELCVGRIAVGEVGFEDGLDGRPVDAVLAGGVADDADAAGGVVVLDDLLGVGGRFDAGGEELVGAVVGLRRTWKASLIRGLRRRRP